MSNGTTTFPFNRLLTNNPPNNCYETIVQPVCHRSVVMCVVYEDSVHYWCATHAPAGSGVVEISPQAEPVKAPVTFPEP